MALVPKNGNDCVNTPLELAEEVVRFVRPSGIVLEPCSGSGNFVKALKEFKNVTQVEHGDLQTGYDFFEETREFDYIVTNPPWSKARPFLQHAMKLTDRICFLITINHFLGLKARFRDMEQAGFWVTDVKLFDTPKEFPQSGFQLGAVVIQRAQHKYTNWS
jgi:hypothetical protein